MSGEETLLAFQRMVERDNAYPVEAYLFVRDGLHAAAVSLHGEEPAGYDLVQQFMQQHGLDWDQLQARYESGALPENIALVIQKAGSCRDLNRHISGGQLCLALRDLALARWGMLARIVLESWRIRRTQDFGRIVFDFIDHSLMQRQPTDSLADFDDVFAFDDAFPLPPRAAGL